MSKRYDLRIVVGTPGGSRSGMWHVFAKRGQVYVSYGTMGGVKKLSFHSQEVCRDAFTSEFGTPATLHRRSANTQMIDSTHVKAHRSAAGGKGGEQKQAIGRSRGGRNTKDHARADARGRLLAILLTGGEAHDCPVAEARHSKPQQQKAAVSLQQAPERRRIETPSVD